MEQKVLFVFIDGLGLGSDDPAVNPLADRSRFPTLGKLLDQSIPLDAQLGVPGLPQSATGQAALLTGLNAPELMGRHIEGFPPPRLKEIIREHNIFSKLVAAGKTCTFANAYWLDDVAHIPSKRESVTTVSTLAALGGVRGKPELLADQAVCHDLTREWIKTHRDYHGPLISPEQAAEHLMDVASQHDFTLFEFFQTDHAGHSGDQEKVFQTLEKLDRFFSRLLPTRRSLGEGGQFDGLLIVTSDHGNIEDLSTRSHTLNPVPLFFQSLKKDKKNVDDVFQKVENISQLTPAILDLMLG
jgi:hypothetical protein